MATDDEWLICLE